MSLEKVTYSDSQLPGYELGPKDKPALVVIQEWFGITESIKEQAKLLHQATGFRVFIPDLYHGKLGANAEEAGHLMNNLDWVKAKDELVTAVKYLKSSGSSKVGVVGFCMGGALTLVAAQHAEVEAAACFYGTPDAQLCQVEKITVPVQLHFGEKDTKHQGFSDLATAKSTYEKIKGAGGTVDLFTYPHCDHGFMNAIIGDDGYAMIKKNGQIAPPKEEVQEAFDRSVSFFKQHLA